jgi:hypothetical protein
MSEETLIAEPRYRLNADLHRALMGQHFTSVWEFAQKFLGYSQDLQRVKQKEARQASYKSRN